MSAISSEPVRLEPPGRRFDGLCPVTGKRSFRSPNEAEKSRKRLKKAGFHGTGRIESYRCRHCHRWHLGHAEAWETRRRKPDKNLKKPLPKCEAMGSTCFPDARSAERRRVQLGGPAKRFGVYHCRHCLKWHLHAPFSPHPES